MKMEHTACINALNDLIKINNDRIAGYQRAGGELQDDRDKDLRMLFNTMIGESRVLKNELESLVEAYGGAVTDGTTASGKLYRAWMDVKALFTGSDRETILNSCEAGEDAAQKAYQSALDDEDVMEQTKTLIRKQKAQLLDAHNEIKRQRGLVAH